MDITKVKTSLQTLITRLKDAEEGFKEIAKASVLPEIIDMCKQYASERHLMHQKLELYLEDLGGTPVVDTSFAGNLHRMWIDLKVNGWGDDFVSIVDEIERGSTILIAEFEDVLKEVALNSSLYIALTKIQENINLELNELKQYQEKISAFQA